MLVDVTGDGAENLAEAVPEPNATTQDVSKADASAAPAARVRKCLRWGTGPDAGGEYTHAMLCHLNTMAEPPTCTPKGKGVVQKWRDFATQVKDLNVFKRAGYDRSDADALRRYVMDVILKENLQQDDYRTGGEDETKENGENDFEAELCDLKVTAQEKYVAISASGST